MTAYKGMHIKPFSLISQCLSRAIQERTNGKEENMNRHTNTHDTTITKIQLILRIYLVLHLTIYTRLSIDVFVVVVVDDGDVKRILINHKNESIL